MAKRINDRRVYGTCSIVGVFAFALRRGWALPNPVAMTDRPPSPPPDPGIRFLGREEWE